MAIKISEYFQGAVSLFVLIVGGYLLISTILFGTPGYVVDARVTLDRAYQEIYPLGLCKSVEHDDEWYVRCFADEVVGAIFQVVELEDGNHQIFWVNGRAGMHAKARQLPVEAPPYIVPSGVISAVVAASSP